MANLGALLHCCSGLVYFDAGLLYFGAGLLYFDPGLAALKHELVDFVVPLEIWGVCPFTSKTLGRYVDSGVAHAPTHARTHARKYVRTYVRNT